MKIRNIGKENVSSLGHTDREGKPADRASETFGDKLHKVQGALARQELENLLSDIDKQGRILGETLNIKDLKKYKDLIQRFLDYAVSKMYKLTEQSGWNRRGRHKIYTMIETVNKELENLTDTILSENKDKISILSKVDEIRGLLLDLYS